MAMSSGTHTFGGRPRSGQTPPRYSLRRAGQLYEVIDTQEEDRVVYGPEPYVVAELERSRLQKAWIKERH